MGYWNHIRSSGTRRAFRPSQRTLCGSTAPRAECRRVDGVEPIMVQRKIQLCISQLHYPSSRSIWPSGTYTTLAPNVAIGFTQHGQFPRHFTAGICRRTADPLSSPPLPATTSISKPDGDHTQEAERTGLDFSRLPSLISTDKGPGDSSSIWYVVTAAALLAFHQAPAVGELWKYISTLRDLDPSEEAAVARRIREACLKSSVLVGFPRGINGLSALQACIEADSPHLLPILGSDTSLRAPISPEAKFERGKRFFADIYAKHTHRILASMDESSGGDLNYFAIAAVYGELMAETSLLNALETVLLEFVCCLADDLAPQAKGHFFGSRNLGATGTEMRGIILLVQELAKQLDIRYPGNKEEFEFLAKAEDW